MLWTRTNTLPFGILWHFGGLWRLLGFLLIAAGALTIRSNSILGGALLACAIIISWYYRSPVRSIPQATPIVVAPVDGLIKKIEEVESIPFSGKPGTLVVISSSLLDAGVIRAPFTGKVGSKAQAGQGSGRQDNEYSGILCTDSRASSMFLGQKATQSRNRITLAPVPGDMIEQGAIIGFNHSGKNVEIFLQNENGYKAVIAKGRKVKSGQTIIALRRQTRAKNVVIERG